MIYYGSALDFDVIDLRAEFGDIAKKMGMSDPFKRSLDRIKSKKKILTVTKADGSTGELEYYEYSEDENIPEPTDQERADFRFEENKYVIKELIKEGFVERAFWEAQHNCYPGDEKRIMDYLNNLALCAPEQNCNMYCPYYQKGCIKK